MKTPKAITWILVLFFPILSVGKTPATPKSLAKNISFVDTKNQLQRAGWHVMPLVCGDGSDAACAATAWKRRSHFCLIFDFSQAEPHFQSVIDGKC